MLRSLDKSNNFGLVLMDGGSRGVRTLVREERSNMRTIELSLDKEGLAQVDDMGKNV